MNNRKTKNNKPTMAEAGARPLSERQREHLSHLRAAQVGRSETLGNRAVVGVHRREPVVPVAPRVRHGAATRARQRAKRLANRKRTDWGKVLLRGARFVLCGEVLAALVFSPRLWVKSVVVAGNATVPTATITKRLAIAPRTNTLRALWERSRFVAALRAEPTVEAATVKPVFPDGLSVVVTERKAFAAVQFDCAPGQWYTLDKNRVPFRVFKGAPEAGLPQVTVATAPLIGAKPVLGSVCNAPGLSDVGTCLAWASAQGDNFPVQKIAVDRAGKLCLNREGDVAVLLGPGLELREKLQTLSLLLTKRADLCGSAPSTIAKVNLFAYDAPALVPRPDAPVSANNVETDP